MGLVCLCLPARVEILHHPPPAAKAKEQETPQIAQKNFGTKKSQSFLTNLSPYEPPPPPRYSVSRRLKTSPTVRAKTRPSLWLHHTNRRRIRCGSARNRFPSRWRPLHDKVDSMKHACT